MNNKTLVRLPLVIALSVAGGIFLGVWLNPGGNADPVPYIFPRSSGNSSAKLNRIVSYIDEYYVDSVQKEWLIDKAIREILEELDPHSYYIPKEDLLAYTEPLEGEFEGIGVEFLILRDTVVVVNPIAGGPSESLGIRAGDRIVKVNGESIAGNGITNRRVMELLKGRKGTKVNVAILRKGKNELLGFTIVRNSIPINSVDAALLLDEQTAYIRVSRFAKNTYEEFEDVLDSLIRKQPLNRLMLDLRGNGGGYLESAIKMCDALLKKGDLIVYTEGKSQPRKDFYSEKEGKYKDLELQILINEGSASASEIVAGAIQDNDRGTIVGRRSFGKGLVQEHLNLPDQSALRLTVARYYTPTGRSIQKPYGEGIAYSDDYLDRMNRGEFYNEDSIPLVDSLVYTTPQGKKVYGGGGIVPDVFVPVDSTDYSPLVADLLYSGNLNQFAFDLVDQRRNVLEQFDNAETFAREFTLEDGIIDSLTESMYPGEMGPYGPLTSRDRDFLKQRLKAFVARNLYGSSGFYSITVPDDPTIRKAQNL